MKINRIIRVAVGMVALVSLNSNAAVVISGANLTPALTITGNCTVSVSSNVPLPVKLVSFTGGVVSSVIGTLLVSGNCTNYRVGADAGTHYTAGVRQLQSGAIKIPYSLDLAGGGVTTRIDWGNFGMTTPANPTASTQRRSRNVASAGLSTDTFTITANATVPTNPTAGTYTDRVAVSIEF